MSTSQKCFNGSFFHSIFYLICYKAYGLAWVSHALAYSLLFSKHAIKKTLGSTNSLGCENWQNTSNEIGLDGIFCYGWIKFINVWNEINFPLLCVFLFCTSSIPSWCASWMIWLQASITGITNCGLLGDNSKLPCNSTLLCPTICLLGSYHFCSCWSSWR